MQIRFMKYHRRQIQFGAVCCVCNLVGYVCLSSWLDFPFQRSHLLGDVYGI